MVSLTKPEPVGESVGASCGQQAGGCRVLEQSWAADGSVWRQCQVVSLPHMWGQLWGQPDQRQLAGRSEGLLVMVAEGWQVVGLSSIGWSVTWVV